MEKILKSWNEYWKADIQYPNNLETIKKSSLIFQNVGKNRPKLWLSLIDPANIDEYGRFYDSFKAKNQVTVAMKVINNIRNDAQKTFGLHLSSLNSDEKIVRIVNVLAIFNNKRPDIGYHFGMTYIVGFLLSVFTEEKDVFVIFCYIIEHIFPDDFFLDADRQVGLHKQLATIAKMAQVLRPKLVNNLKAVFVQGKNKEMDLTGFSLFIQRTAKKWVRSLFVPYLLVDDTARVWDCIMIYKFPFIIKFSLCLLSKHETFINNTVKIETKALNLGITVDSLIISGNLTREKLFRKLEKLDIEKMVKKAMTKRTYVAVRAENFAYAAEVEEKDNSGRVESLKKVRKMIEACSIGFDSVSEVLNSLTSLSVKNVITRNLFISISTKEFKWTNKVSNSVWTALDQDGEDSLHCNIIKVGLALLSKTSLKEKLALCFLAFKELKDEIFLESAFEMLMTIETVIDSRSKIIKENIKTISEQMKETMDFDYFYSKVISDTFCEPILTIINIIEDSEEVESSAVVNSLLNEGYYTGTHSPLVVSGDATPDSDESLSPPEYNEIVEDALEEDFHQFTAEKKHYEEVFKTEETKAVFSFEEGGDGISIKNEYFGKVVKFIVIIGSESEEETKEIDKEDEETPQITEISNIDIPEAQKMSKERSGCSRLCGTQSCSSF